MKNFLILFLILSLTACTHYYYAPNAANIPLFKEKNTFKGKAGIGGGNNYTGGDIQLAYSAGKNIGIILNSFFAGKTEQVQENTYSSTTHQEFGKGSYYETGIGYYKPLGEKKAWIFETYAGAGTGSENHLYYSLETSKLKITKYFLQPSIGYSSPNETFEIAIGSRFSGLNLKINQNNVSFANNQKSKEELDSISIHPSSILWEPSIMVAAGWPNFKIFVQLTKAENLTNSYLLEDNENFNVGLRFTFKNGSNTNQNDHSQYIGPSL